MREASFSGSNFPMLVQFLIFTVSEVWHTTVWIRMQSLLWGIHCAKPSASNSRSAFCHRIWIWSLRKTRSLCTAMPTVTSLVAIRVLGSTLKYLQRCLRLQPGFQKALAVRAQILSELGRREKALQDLNRLLHQDPAKSGCLTQRAIILLEQGIVS